MPEKVNGFKWVQVKQKSQHYFQVKLSINKLLIYLIIFNINRLSVLFSGEYDITLITWSLY